MSSNKGRGKGSGKNIDTGSDQDAGMPEGQPAAPPPAGLASQEISGGEADDKDQTAAAEGRTVFIPLAQHDSADEASQPAGEAGAALPQASNFPPAEAEVTAEPEEVAEAEAGAEAEAEAGAGAETAEGTATAPAPSNPSRGVPAAQGGELRGIRPGDVLNHIFEVRRFIARGGMGEVFEGINVNSDERVAIKVILPHLAADAQVLAMFRKEARTLTRLSHASLVQYRVLAQEPELGVFYIVTEYIDGANLSDLLKTLDFEPHQLVGLARRLAQGLAAAHALGAIHRDIAPDNIMLEDGQLEKARIIDFGIAKDLDAATGTIVGDGFAGKLNYVAPEQLGDFGRQIGAWTDVYSLGLTLLAVASKRDVDMGGSLVDAVDKRRGTIDLSPAPPELRPVLERMLKADPAERFRSMEAVVDALPARSALSSGPASGPSFDPTSGLPPAPPSVPPAGETAGQMAAGHEATVFAPSMDGLADVAGGQGKLETKSGARDVPKGGSNKRKLAIAGGLAAVVLAAGAIYSIVPSSKDAGDPDGAAAAPIAPANETQLREKLTAALPTLPCSWLELDGLTYAGNDVSLAFSGVAGRATDAGIAQDRISNVLVQNGLQASSIDFSQVKTVNVQDCRPIETFRQIGRAGLKRMRPEQAKFELRTLGAEAGQYEGRTGALAIVEIDLSDVPGQLALVGLDQDGSMFQFADRAAVRKEEQIRPNVYRVRIGSDHMGWSGVLMLTGDGQFSKDLLSGTPASRPADWGDKVLEQAAKNKWSAEMAWYQTVDDVPN